MRLTGPGTSLFAPILPSSEVGGCAQWRGGCAAPAVHRPWSAVPESARTPQSAQRCGGTGRNRVTYCTLRESPQSTRPSATNPSRPAPRTPGAQLLTPGAQLLAPGGPAPRTFAKTAASGRAEAPVLAKLRAAGWGSGGADRVGRPGEPASAVGPPQSGVGGGLIVAHTSPSASRRCTGSPRSTWSAARSTVPSG